MLKLTDHFLHRTDIPIRQAEPYAGERALSYQPEQDGPLFPLRERRPETHEKVMQIRRQYRIGTDKLRQFLLKHSPDHDDAGARGFRTLADRVNDDETGGFFSTEISLLYGEGKYALDSLCVDIDNETIPLHKRVSEISNLAEGLEVCASGTLENLRKAAAELRLSAGDVRDSARNVWENIAREVLREFADQEHRYEPNYEGNETHYVAGYQNMLADRFGLPVRTDHAIPPHLGELYEECAEYLHERLTPTRLVRTMAESCLARIQAHYNDYRGRPLSEDEVWKMRQDYSALEPELRQSYGHIEAGILFNEHDAGGDDDEAFYTLIDNPTMLMHAIAKNLRDAGVLKPFKTTYAVGQRHAAHAIKQIGDDAFYVKTRDSGAVRMRPVQLDDLPADEKRPEVILAALANTHDSSVLARFPAHRVWHALDACPPPMDWLAELSSPAIRRYRQANQLNGFILLDLACEKVENGPADQRWTAAASALGKDDVNLAMTLELLAWDLDTPDDSGNTFLHHACRLGIARVVEAGLEKTFQVDAMNDRWETPLMVAASHGHHDAVRLLLGNERKPALEMRDSAGRTPLMLAARNGQGAVVQILLAHGADLHAHDRQGWTALMHAAVRNDAETMEALLAAGATIGAFRPANLDPAQWGELARRIDAVVGLLQMRTPPHAW